ncbi:TPA: glycosyltransferase family 4 protein [Candidatus Bathyarchaeota archaeon]|nr:glycosyltransferase family 4 protein [Candidatus Bathyarchaeota archaeon]
MRVCFVSPEAFAWGVHGGFGYVTRTLARELAGRGVDVSVVTPRRKGQREVEELDGFTVYGYPSHAGEGHILRAIRSRLDSLPYYKMVDADVYHSQEASYNTVAAQHAAPRKAHVITFQDPYDVEEWRRIGLVESTYAMNPVFGARLWLERRVLAHACRGADALYTQAHFLAPRANRLYWLKEDPAFLPNPVYIPRRTMRKSPTPMVCFLARWDPQKRVELFLELARRFPDVGFVAIGQGHNSARDAGLRRLYGRIPNLRLTGFIDEEEKSRVLEASWALVNTSVREALPVSFLEALAHETPIISGEDPDSITSTFGYRVEGDDYSSGVAWLLASEEWRVRGRNGRRYVEATHEVGGVVQMHIDAYWRVLGEG